VHAIVRPPELKELTLISELGRNEVERAFLHIYSIGNEIGRSLVAPPGTPKQRVEIWRRAFSNMLADFEFKEAVTKGAIRIEPLNGEELAGIVANVTKLPAETVAEARIFYGRLLSVN
jgi:hypothetical protein